MHTCPHCRKPILRETEALELKSLRKFKSLTTSGVARLYNKSLSNASNMLSRWHKAGFLERTERVQESGGYEFVYTHPKERPDEA